MAFVVFPDFQLLDLTGPLAAFQIVGRFFPEKAYEIHVLSATGGRIRSSVGLEIDTESDLSATTHTIQIVGGWGVRAACLDSVIQNKVAVWSEGARVTSVCTGAFLLAAMGWLDGLRATTHWRSAPEFAQRFPKVRLEADRIFVRDGRFWTSAGITAGIDLALALIEEDFGRDVARGVSRELVVPQRRMGGQSQFSAWQELVPESDRLARVVQFIRDHLSDSLPVDVLADVACLSPRQFSRRFRQETGMTPAQTVDRLRAEAARPLIEDTECSLEEVAGTVGFGDPERLRRSLVRWFGQPPQALRRLRRTNNA